MLKCYINFFFFRLCFSPEGSGRLWSWSAPFHPHVWYPQQWKGGDVCTPWSGCHWLQSDIITPTYYPFKIEESLDVVSILLRWDGKILKIIHHFWEQTFPKSMKTFAVPFLNKSWLGYCHQSHTHLERVPINLDHEVEGWARRKGHRMLALLLAPSGVLERIGYHNSWTGIIARVKVKGDICPGCRPAL